MKDEVYNKKEFNRKKWKKKNPKISCSIFEIGKPNLNGHIYSKEVVEKTVENFNEKNKNDTIYGELDPAFPTSSEISLCNVSHKVTELYINSSDNTLDCNLEVLDTPKGNLLKDLLEKNLMNSESFGVASRGYGNLNSSTNEVENYKLISFDIVRNSAFKNSNLKISDL